MRALLLLLSLSISLPVAAAPLVVDVPMADGVTLHTRVYAPNDNFTVERPVVLLRTPYGAYAAAETSKLFDLLLNDAQYMNNRGLIYVTQDLRGLGLSAGEPTFRFVGDTQDTYDTLAWIDEQPWSNGKVMMWGVSAPGIVAALALQNPPPNLSSVMAVVPTGDLHQAFFEGGAFREELVDGWLPIYGGAGLEDVARAHEVRDSFWDDGILTNAEVTAHASSVKTLFVGGTEDIFVRGTTTLATQMQTLSPATDDHFFVLGPWTHSTLVANPFEGGGFIGSIKFPISSFFQPGQPIDSTNYFAAFSSWSIGTGQKPNFPAARVHRTQILDAADIISQVRVQGSWVSFDAWPPPEAIPTTLYLYADQRLGLEPSPAQPALTYTADPADPVPTVGGAMLFENAVNGFGGWRHQAALLARDDVLVFETPAADASVDIIGNIEATIWAAADTTDLDVNVKLLQKTNDGLYIHLADGMRRGRFVATSSALTPLVPGEPLPFVVDVGPVAVRLRSGHALAVMIQSSNHARFDIATNVAAPLSDSPTPLVANVELFTGGPYPSSITLPVVDGELPSALPPPGGPLDGGIEVAPDGGAIDSGPSADGGDGDGDGDGGLTDGGVPGTTDGGDVDSGGAGDVDGGDVDGGDAGDVDGGDAGPVVGGGPPESCSCTQSTHGSGAGGVAWFIFAGIVLSRRRRR